MSPEETLIQASQLIRANQYRQARHILETIPDHPKAQEWMSRIDDILFQQDPFGDVLFTDEEIVAQATGEYDKPKRPYNIPVIAPKRDYATLAVFSLFLYWFLWLPGFILNLYFLQEARRYKRETGLHPNGLGCLWWLLLFNIIIPLGFCLLIILFAAVFPVDEFVVTPTKLLR